MEGQTLLPCLPILDDDFPSLPIDESTVIAIVAVIGVVYILCICLGLCPAARAGIEITQLYVYPVKGLRGCKLEEARLGPYGIVGDRTFCLQTVRRDEKGVTYETMFIGHHLHMSLFVTSLHGKEVEVKWEGRGTDFDMAKGVTTPDKLRFPLRPSVEGRPSFEVSLHKSSTMAYDMGDDLSGWFSDRFGFEVRLVHIGDGSRPVLGSLAPNSPGGLRRARLSHRVRSFIPFAGHPAERLVFNDVAHYLVVTEESNSQVTSRLASGKTMDVTKFRPNIVIKGGLQPFVEDFWGEITFWGGLRMQLTANCYRCQSITVDYKTGTTAKDAAGAVWKMLSKDRRVDKGAKYSPVFGRYGYCFGDATGEVLKVGQKAVVSHVNVERSTFDWPGLATFGMRGPLRTKKIPRWLSK